MARSCACCSHILPAAAVGKGMAVLETVMEILTAAKVGLLWCPSQAAACKLTLGSILKDLMGWLLSHRVPRERVDKQPTEEAKLLAQPRARAYSLGRSSPPHFSPQACGEEPSLCHGEASWARPSNLPWSRGDSKFKRRQVRELGTL